MARTTILPVSFRNPFRLKDVDEVLPPGTYEIETDEELMDGISFHAYRRVQTLIHLPSKTGNPLHSQTLAIDPDELAAALANDAASDPETPPAAITGARL
ncbi:MAG: hypothetical protein RJQ21_01375 [Rhodospirillales bacterium]